MWRILDLLFPLCPWAWLARERAVASLPKYSLIKTIHTERFSGGWVVVFSDAQGESFHRVVLRATGVVYRAVGGYPGLKQTQAYFRRHRAALPGNLWGGRRVWCLQIPCSRSECDTIARTLNAIFETPELPGKPENWRTLPGPIFYGSRTAMQWLSDRLAEQGLTSRVRCVLRFHVRRARLFRITHFAMSLPDALRDNGDSWHGNAPFNRFEEARWRQ